MANKHTATCPNGAIVRRTSATRVYTHVVVARHSYAHDLAGAQRVGEPGAKDHIASNFEYYRQYLDGTSEFLQRREWHTDESYERERKASIERAEQALNGTTTVEEYRAMLKAQALARVADRKAAGYYDKFEALGWCSRPDLAAKLANSKRGELYDDVTILETNYA